MNLRGGLYMPNQQEKNNNALRKCFRDFNMRVLNLTDAIGKEVHEDAIVLTQWVDHIENKIFDAADDAFMKSNSAEKTIRDNLPQF